MKSATSLPTSRNEIPKKFQNRGEPLFCMGQWQRPYGTMTEALLQPWPPLSPSSWPSVVTEGPLLFSLSFSPPLSLPLFLLPLLFSILSVRSDIKRYEIVSNHTTSRLVWSLVQVQQFLIGGCFWDTSVRWWVVDFSCNLGCATNLWVNLWGIEEGWNWLSLMSMSES